MLEEREVFLFFFRGNHRNCFLRFDGAPGIGKGFGPVRIRRDIHKKVSRD